MVNPVRINQESAYLNLQQKLGILKFKKNLKKLKKNRLKKTFGYKIKADTAISPVTKMCFQKAHVLSESTFFY